jgi:isopentenyl diphosphate isomerase/L-lactate dehydrogenase-like FMN-dependent dehydrogenase
MELLSQEVSRNMALLGVTALDQLDASHLVPRHPHDFNQGTPP